MAARQFVYLLILISTVLKECESFKYKVLYTVPPPPEIPWKSNLDPIEEYRFTQKLDHFNSSEKATWRQYKGRNSSIHHVSLPQKSSLFKLRQAFLHTLNQAVLGFACPYNHMFQRYYLNRLYYKPGGPVFFLFSGESEMKSGFLQTAGGRQMDDMMSNAKRHNAMVFTMEHRYYGQSVPIANAERVENMRYLDARQALADTAEFIRYVNVQHFYLQEPPKWIVFGGSYSGSLAGWMRQQYPDMITGAISSSGGMDTMLEFPDFIKTVANDLKLLRQSCYDETKVAFEKVVASTKTQEGRDFIKKRLNLCHNVIADDRLSLGALIDSLMSPYMKVCQYGGDTHAGEHFTEQTVAHLCDIMDDKDGKRPDHFDRLIFLLKWQQQGTGEPWDCIDNSHMETMDGNREMNSGRGWEWQLCNELGTFLTTPKDDNDHPFGGNILDLEILQLISLKKSRVHNLGYRFRMQICKQVFNMTIDDVKRKLDYAISWHGRMRDFNATNVVLVEGTQDPFHMLGIYKEEWQRPGQRIVVMKGKSHCADMSVHMPDDPSEVLRARKVIQEEIDKWLS